MNKSPTEQDIALAKELLAEWNDGRGTSKSQLEIRTWNDSTSHGRHFDRFIRTTLGVKTSKPSKQTILINQLQAQVRTLGQVPVGTNDLEWQRQLHHARASCLAALRTWNDPMANFRTGAFSLLFVTAWNSLALALLQRDGKEWRRINADGEVKRIKGEEQSLDTKRLIKRVFSKSDHRGIRKNIEFWIDLRNAVAHRYMPNLDMPVIPWAQAGLLNIENVLTNNFGSEYALSEQLSVPLQLSGFRDPGILESRKRLQSSLPLNVQTILDRADTESPELVADPTYMMRVAFIPFASSSGRNPDIVAYFVRPGEVPHELESALDRCVVLSKPTTRHQYAAMHVIDEVKQRTGYRFNSNLHAQLARKLGARPPKDEQDRTVDLKLAEYISSFKRYLYSQSWIDLLVDKLSSPEAYIELTGRRPISIKYENTDDS